MALTDTQKDMLMEITGIATREELDWRAFYLNAAQEATVIADITLWNSFRDKHTKLNGGEYAIDSDPARTRAAIRQRCYLRLRMIDVISPDGSIRLVRA